MRSMSMQRHHQLLVVASVAALALLGLALTDSTLHGTALYAADGPSRSLLAKNDPRRNPRRKWRHAQRQAAAAEAAAAAAGDADAADALPDDEPVAAAAPVIQPPPGEPRVAHCIVGQRRTMDHPMIYQNYQAHVLSKIGAPSDVYFVLDGPTDATDLYQPIAVAYEEVEGMYFQYRRWSKCLSLVKDHEDATNVRYSHVIFQRADQVVLMDVPSIETFPATTIWSKPYGEQMDEYLPVYTTGDDNAQPPHVVWFGIADLFLIMSRQVAFDLVNEVQTIYTEWGTTARVTCGPKGAVHIHSPPEKTLKCAASRRAIPVVHQNFQLRLLRPHEKMGCHFFRAHHSKHYNSLCI